MARTGCRRVCSGEIPLPMWKRWVPIAWSPPMLIRTCHARGFAHRRPVLAAPCGHAGAVDRRPRGSRNSQSHAGDDDPGRCGRCHQFRRARRRQCHPARVAPDGLFWLRLDSDRRSGSGATGHGCGYWQHDHDQRRRRLRSARNQPLQVQARVRMLSDGHFVSESYGEHWYGGNTAVLQAGAIILIVTSRAVSLYDRSLFYAHGQDPTRFGIVVVKSPHCQPHMFKDWAARYNRRRLHPGRPAPTCAAWAIPLPAAHIPIRR